MKIIKILNSIAIVTPLVLFLIGFADHEYFIFGLVSLMFTGGLQTLLALFLWFKEMKNKFLIGYFSVSIMFFLYFFAINEFDLDNVFSVEFWIIPTILALSLSAFIYMKKSLSA